MTTTYDRLLTIGEAHDKLRISRSKLYKLMSSGEIQSIKIGHLRRVPVEAVDDYIARRLGEAVTLDAA